MHPSTGSASSPPRNFLLRDLPKEEARKLATRLEPVRLDLHEEIYASQGRIGSVYFPEDAMISLVTQMKSGASVEVGVVGRYGMAGLSAFLGSDKASSEAFVQLGGKGFKLPLSDFRSMVTPTTRLHSRLLSYTNAFLFQSSQAAACNALHNVEQRSARWLLTVADQIGADEFELTHEFLAQMLGVRRAGVTEAQAILRSKGLIASRRGRISIRNRSGLEKAACECFGVIHRELERARVQSV
jgi:CRP-like cAMP-binding protein